MTIKNFLACMAVLANLGPFACPAWATAITVSNFSFESPALGNNPGDYTIGQCPTLWNCTANGGQSYFGGVYVPTSTQFPAGDNGLSGGAIVPNGTQAAWMEGASPQVLEQYTSGPGSIITNNTTYTLSVWAGARADQADAWTLCPGSCLTGNYHPTIEILANGVVVASQVTTDPGLGSWKDFTLTWKNLSAYTGETLGIELVVPARSGGDTLTTQVAWDDVTMNYTVPEPASLALFGTALLGLVAILRRKRKTG